MSLYFTLNSYTHIHGTRGPLLNNHCLLMHTFMWNNISYVCYVLRFWIASILRFSIQSYVANYKLVNRKFGMCQLLVCMYVWWCTGAICECTIYAYVCWESFGSGHTHWFRFESPLGFCQPASRVYRGAKANTKFGRSFWKTSPSPPPSLPSLYYHHHQCSLASSVVVYVRYQLCAELARPALTLTKPLEIRWSHLPAYGTRFRQAFNAHSLPLTSSVHIATVVDPPTHPVLGEIHCHNFSRGKIEYG